ncbi:MAG: FAD-dependent oxidoreductase [Candidatus Micrarchaeota archaeon]
MAQVKRYRLDSVKETSCIAIFEFSPIDGKTLDFKPGQFVMLHKDGIKRAYSLASSPSSEKLRFGIKFIGGQMTNKLAAMKPGDEIGVEGPYGHFAYAQQKKCVFVAGGSALIPFISMLKYIDEQKIKGEFYLFYSSKSQNDICFRDFLSSLSKKGIHCILTLTRETPARWKGEIGRINEDMIRKYVKTPSAFSWYVCGPGGLVSSIRELASSLEVKDFKFEGWGIDL